MQLLIAMEGAALLKELVGETVSVWTGRELDHRNDIGSSGLCVNGTLEAHPTNGQYRVLVNDGNYAYFKAEDLYSILTHPREFKDGAKAVVTLKF